MFVRSVFNGNHQLHVTGYTEGMNSQIVVQVGRRTSLHQRFPESKAREEESERNQERNVNISRNPDSGQDPSCVKKAEHQLAGDDSRYYHAKQCARFSGQNLDDKVW